MNNYLGYMEVLESAGWAYSTDINKLKGEWCFAMRIFEVPPDFDYEVFKTEEKPRYPKISERYSLIYSWGNLMHEKETT